MVIFILNTESYQTGASGQYWVKIYLTSPIYQGADPDSVAGRMRAKAQVGGKNSRQVVSDVFAGMASNPFCLPSVSIFLALAL